MIRLALTRPRRRWLLLLGLSLLLHVLLIGGFPGWPVLTPQPPRTINATLLPAAVPEPESRPEPAPELTPPAPTPPVPRPSDATSSRPSPPEPRFAEPLETPPALPEPVPLPQPPVLLPPAEAPKPPRPGVFAVAPSSATLHYRVEANDPRTEPPRMYFGGATMLWKTDGQNYNIDLQIRVNILFVSIGALSSHSEGQVGETGLLPARYIETPRSRSTLSVNFNRDERSSVTFSASTNSLPLTANMQDRLSMLIQLGALLRGNPALAQSGANAPNAAFDIAVAGTRGTVESWRFIPVGRENVDTGAGVLPTLHLRRAPRARTDPAQQSEDHQTMDIWIATGSNLEGADVHASAQGYPARIRFADANAVGYDLKLEKIE